ncbi:cyclodeaminase/cyclohydrolase family protein [Candidatus Acetothermia bacterium]|nr:cyclodeaminase/cyclohydrolase family protein [Candidatus Acetothermia bacterium]
MNTLKKQSIDGFLNAIAAEDPTPGGGSVAAFTGAVAACLITMVCAITASKSDNPALGRIAASSKELRERLLILAEEDGEAFKRVMTAYRLPKSDHRRCAIDEALIKAAEVPLETAQRCIDLLVHLDELVQVGSKSTVSDIGVAVLLAMAAIDGALLNVMININQIKERKLSERFRLLNDELTERSKQLSSACLAAVRARL